MNEIYAKTIYVVTKNEKTLHAFYEYEKAIDYIFMICMNNREQIKKNISIYNEHFSDYGIFKIERIFID